DFNGDQVLDLAVANFDSNNVSILRGIGDGTFQAAGSYAAGRQPRSVAAADFNGDGTSDLAVANFDTFDSDTDDVSVLLGNGDGTLQAASGATTLSVILDGAGTGTVTSSESPRRISCGTSCTASYTFNTPVALTATPSAGSTFTGWRVIGAAGCA